MAADFYVQATNDNALGTPYPGLKITAPDGLALTAVALYNAVHTIPASAVVRVIPAEALQWYKLASTTPVFGPATAP